MLTFFMPFVLCFDQSEEIDRAASTTTINAREINQEAENLIQQTNANAVKPVTFWRAWLLPGVAMVMNKSLTSNLSKENFFLNYSSILYAMLV